MPPDQEMTMADKKKNKKKNTKKVEETAVAEIHWVRSTLILVVVLALTFGIWYLVSERD
jgi:predicted secreted protein